MMFLLYWIASLLVWVVVVAGWTGLALLSGLPAPNGDQIAGVGYTVMALSQVAAVLTIGFLIWAEHGPRRDT